MTATAKLIMNGDEQVVQLPEEFRLPGTEVTIRRLGPGVFLEPVGAQRDVKAWFAKLDECGGKDFLPEGRPEQPQMPPQRAFFNDEDHSN